MMITVTGLGALANKIGKNRVITVSEGVTVFLLKEHLGLSRNAQISCVINEKVEKQSAELHEGDDVKLMNLFSGG